MTANRNIRIEALTRREFREGRERGHYRAVILALGSLEQHLEHLAVAQDITSSLLVAERAADLMYPDVLVAAPIAVGVSEHHMQWGPTVSVSPQAWLSVVYDATESLVRHGVAKVLLLNGHGGNMAPAEGVMEQWRYRLAGSWTDAGRQEFADAHDHSQYVGALESAAARELDVRFHSYWDLILDEVRAATMVSKGPRPCRGVRDRYSDARISTRCRGRCDRGVTRAVTGRGRCRQGPPPAGCGHRRHGRGPAGDAGRLDSVVDGVYRRSVRRDRQ